MNSGNSIGPGPAGAAAHEAIRTAEQAVSDAWIGQLMLTESEAEAVVRACARVRQRAADRVRTAQRTGDLAALAESQSDLETADAGWGRALAAQERAGAHLTDELAIWSESTAQRVRQRLSERSTAGHR